MAVEAVEKPRLRPEAALLDGGRDSAWLLILWYLRKSTLGIVGFSLAVSFALNSSDEINSETLLDFSPEAPNLLPTFVLLLAMLLRFVTDWAGVALAYKLARIYEKDLEPRTNAGHWIGEWLDRYKVARAYSSLRWTHHVRQIALCRIGAEGRRLALLDPVLDVTNIASFALAFLVLLLRA